MGTFECFGLEFQLQSQPQALSRYVMLRTLSRCHFVIAETQVSCQGVVRAEPIHAGSLQWGNDFE